MWKQRRNSVLGVRYGDGPLGLGIELRDSRLMVDQVFPNAQPGIQCGDQILAVGNTPVRGLQS